MNIQQKIAKVKGIADVVFCIDATGSMQPCIDQVKANVEAFTGSIVTAYPNSHIDWRARIIAYRDFFKDSVYIMNDFPFVNTAEEVKAQLDQVVADGGEDEPESTLDAILYASKKSDWRKGVHKIVVVFTDATPLENISPITISELGIPDDLEIIFQTLFIEDRIKLFLFGQKHPIYDKIQEQSRTTVKQFENAIEELKVADFTSILETIGKTVSQMASTGNVF
jgi:hypothetical protein